VADGMFPRFMNPQRFELFEPHLNAGFAKSGSQKSLATYNVCPFVPISMGDDLDEARLPIKQNLALYIGGMGAPDKNFYNDAAKRMGYEAAGVRIQDAFLVGRKAEAVAAVPDALVDEIALVGSADRNATGCRLGRMRGNSGTSIACCSAAMPTRKRCG